MEKAQLAIAIKTERVKDELTHYIDLRMAIALEKS